MEKGYMLGILLLVIVMVGCQTEELPPEPGEPGTAGAQEGGAPTGQAYAYYEGYAPPVDVFDNDKQIFFLGDYVFNLDPIQEYLGTEIKVAHEGGYIYRYYYVYTNNGWEKRQFREDTVSGSNWIKDVANDYVSIKTNAITPGENYIVAYSCKKYNNQWRCGCSGIYGQCNQWMLNTYLYRNVDLPPEPIEPGSITTMRIWVSPRGELVEEGNQIYLDVYFNSRKYDLDQLGDIGSVRIVKPDKTEDWVEVNKRGDVYCEEYESEFNCHVGFYAEYTPTMLGEHLIDFGDSMEVPENYKIETGYFRVVDSAMFGDYLILSDIAGLVNENHGGHYYGEHMSFWTNYRNAQYQWVHVNVNLPEEKLYVVDWEELNISGNVIYFRTDGNEYGNWVNYQWLSGNVRVELHSYTPIEEVPLDLKLIVEAYLEKWPANEPMLCTDTSECTSEEKTYCSGSNACTSTTYYSCIDGKCVSVGGGGGCVPCPNGCADGVCIPETTTADFTIKLIGINQSAINQAKLEFNDNAGNSATPPLFYSNAGILKLGDYNDDLMTQENSTQKNDYIILTAPDQSSYVLRYKGANKVTDPNPLVKFDNIATGLRIEVAYDSSTGATLKLGGYSFKVEADSDDTLDDFDVLVDLDADGSITGAKVNIVDEGKASMSLVSGSADFQIVRIGTNQAKLRFNDNNGNLATVILFYASSVGTIYLGDFDNELKVQEGEHLHQNDYLILTASGQSSYALRYKGADKYTNGTGVVKFDELGTGDRIEATYDSETGATLKLSGNTFKVTKSSDDTFDNFDVLVDLNGDGTIGTNYVHIVTNGGKSLAIE